MDCSVISSPAGFYARKHKDPRLFFWFVRRFVTPKPPGAVGQAEYSMINTKKESPD